MKIDPVTLEGEFVRLEPMRIEHIEPLYTAGADESLWRWTTNFVTDISDMRTYVETALEDFERRFALPFVTIDKAENVIVGSTRLGNIDTKNRRAEIGWTWINPNWQRTFINSEAKLLMLTHAFETWNCVRVELKTDVFNEKSRNAIQRIGAKEEGILRRHMLTYSGRFRDSVYFSIIDSEWQDVKENLSAKLRSYR
jgi:RimJ/RimL family protein N-acetyltransferase